MTLVTSSGSVKEDIMANKDTHTVVVFLFIIYYLFIFYKQKHMPSE